MALMANNYDVRSVAGWFRIIAIAEALSWAGLLVGMYFKYLGSPQTEIGVKIFGPIHGGVFVVYLGIAVLTAVKLKWDVKATLLALVAAFPPFGTVIFEIWAARTGRLAELSTGRPTADAKVLS